MALAAPLGAATDSLDWARAIERLPCCQALDPADRQRLRELVTLFLLDKGFEGAAGLVVGDDMRLWVALQACVLILNLGLEYYSGWSAIILYPGDFRVRRQHAEQLAEPLWEHESLALVHETTDERSGESWPRGPVILSWQAVNSRDPGQNIVLHEFAHKIDMLNGEADGFPPLHPGMHATAWTRDFEAAYQGLCDTLDSGEPVGIDPYAAENPAEFFAVLSETFFIDPRLVHRDFPAVYRHLKDFYRQDPHALLAGGNSER